MLCSWREYAADHLTAPGNQNALRHGLAGISHRRINGALTHAEESIRDKILAGLVAGQGGKSQISSSSAYEGFGQLTTFKLKCTFGH